MGNGVRFTQELKERAVRLVWEQVKGNELLWPAIVSVASKLGCSAETLRRWVRQAERDAGISASVGSVGDGYDNAMAETINGLYKAEVIHRRGPWRGLEAVEYATPEWIDWFNNRRLLEPIGYIPPAEFEKTYYTENESLALGAGLT